VGRRLVSGVLWSALLVVSLLAALPSLLPYLLPRLAAGYGVELSLGRASYALPGPDLRLQQLRIGAEPRPLRLRDLRLGLDLRALIRGDLRLARASLEGGDVEVEARPDGAGYRLAVAPDLPIPPVDDLTVTGVTVRLAGRADAAVLFDTLRLGPPGGAAPAPGRAVEAEGQVAGAAFGTRGVLTLGPDGFEAEGDLSLRRLDLKLIGPLAGESRAGIEGGRLEAELSGRLALDAEGAWRLVAEGSVDAVGLGLRAAGLRLEAADGRWEGRGTVEGGAGRGMTLQVGGRLELDRGRLSIEEATAVQALEVEGLTLDGQARGPEPGAGWALDGDGSLSRIEVRSGGWAGLAASGLSVWGLWRGSGGDLSLGQARIDRVALPPALTGHMPGVALTARDVEVLGLSAGADGLTVDRLVTGSVLAGDGGDARSPSLARAEASEVVVTPALTRVGTLELVTLALPGARNGVGLGVGRLVLLGLRAAPGEALHLGEVRLTDARLGVTRDPEGGWQGPAVPGAGRVQVTLDALLVNPPGRVVLTDARADPPARVTLSAPEGRLSAWDRGHPGRFSVRGDTEGGGTFQVSGQLGAWPDPVPRALRVRFTGLPLTGLAGYLREGLGVLPAGGELDGLVEVQSDGGQWQGRATLAVQGLVLAGSPVDGWSSPGLRALRLLADERGRSGFTLVPGEGLDPVGRLPVTLAEAAAAAYRPIGLSEGEVRQLLAEGHVTLSVVRGAAGAGGLQASGSALLESLAAGLRSHPAVTVSLCPAPASGDAGDPAEGEAVLAAARSVLVGVGGLPPERVSRCPERPGPPGPPAVEVGLELTPLGRP
jgi:hypothetical protein